MLVGGDPESAGFVCVPEVGLERSDVGGVVEEADGVEAGGGVEGVGEWGGWSEVVERGGGVGVGGCWVGLGVGG